MNTSKKICLTNEQLHKKPIIRIMKEPKEKFSEIILQSFPEAFLLLSKSGTIKYAGTQINNIFGKAPSEIIGRNFSHFVPEEYLITLKKNFNNLFSENKIDSIRIEILDAQKKRIPVKIKARKIRKGNINFGLITIHDISRHLKNKEQLIEDKILAGEIGALKSLLIRQHVIELNLQVDKINFFIQEIKNQPNLKPICTQYLSAISKSNIEISETIQRMQDTARINISQLDNSLKPFNINVLISELIIEFNDLFSKSKNLLFAQRTLSDKNAVIISDKFLIHRVFSILLRNSLKVTKEGSISFGYKLADGMIEFNVKDSGLPISKEKLNLLNNCDSEKIEANFSVDCVKKELPVAKSTILKMGGGFRYEESPFEGNEYYFSIPYLPEK